MGREGDVSVSLRRSTILGVCDDEEEYDRDEGETWTREAVFILERRTLFLLISAEPGHAVRKRRSKGLMVTSWRVR
jgi:hypothetical protein